MKQKIVIFFFIGYFLLGSRFTELLKIPILIDHFIEHQSKDINFDFVDFMVMHYMSGNIKDDDYEQDQKLPFKSENSCCHNTCQHIYYYQQNKIEVQEFLSENTSINQYIIEDKNAISYNYNCIWQPPKIG